MKAAYNFKTTAVSAYFPRKQICRSCILQLIQPVSSPVFLLLLFYLDLPWLHQDFVDVENTLRTYADRLHQDFCGCWKYTSVGFSWTFGAICAGRSWASSVNLTFFKPSASACIFSVPIFYCFQPCMLPHIWLYLSAWRPCTFASLASCSSRTLLSGICRSMLRLVARPWRVWAGFR